MLHVAGSGVGCVVLLIMAQMPLPFSTHHRLSQQWDLGIGWVRRAPVLRARVHDLVW